MSQRFQNGFNGIFALGVFSGFAIATFGYLWVSDCEVDPVLWFCGESASTITETFKLISDVVSFTAWPIIVFLVAMIFRNHIRDLLPRITKAGPTGVEFSSDNRKQTASPKSLDELAPIPNMVRTRAIADLELELHKTLATIDKDGRENLLVRELAQARLDFVFLDIYRMIFGSQYQLLKRMKANSGFATKNEVAHFFESLKEAKEVHRERTLDEYIRFIEVRQLVHWDGDELILSPIGEDFLAFVFNRSLTEEIPN